MLPPCCRNAPCPPASWVDSGSVHTWHYIWVSHTTVRGGDWLCCQREQLICGPTGFGESGRPSQCDGFGSCKTYHKLIVCPYSSSCQIICSVCISSPCRVAQLLSSCPVKERIWDVLIYSWKMCAHSVSAETVLEITEWVLPLCPPHGD